MSFNLIQIKPSREGAVKAAGIVVRDVDPAKSVDLVTNIIIFDLQQINYNNKDT